MSAVDTSNNTLSEELESEIETLQAMYDTEEININKKDSMMVIDYITKINQNTIKIIFAFNINDIVSSIIITVKNIEMNKHNLNESSINLIVSHLKKKFQEEIENMPIYQCIDYFNNELKQNQTLFNRSKSSKKPKSKHKQKKKRAKDEEKEEKKENKTDSNSTEETEYIAFIRFNHLLNGKQHKKENQMMSELKSLKNCSESFFGYYFYGTPGIICICSTSDIIKQFARKCNEIGKKSLISYIIQCTKSLKIQSNTIQSIDHDHNEKLKRNEVKNLVINLEIENEDEILSVILTGQGTDFESLNNCNNNNNKKELYYKDCKYDFEIEIKTSNGPYATTNGNLYMTIFGENDHLKLVDRHKFEVKPDENMKKKRKTGNITFKFEFEDIGLLNNIGNLSKLYLENDSKDSWQCEWIKISVYQMSSVKGKGKQSKKKAKKNKPILKYQYEVKMRKWVNKNTPRYAYLNPIKLK